MFLQRQIWNQFIKRRTIVSLGKVLLCLSNNRAKKKKPGGVQRIHIWCAAVLKFKYMMPSPGREGWMNNVWNPYLMHWPCPETRQRTLDISNHCFFENLSNPSHSLLFWTSVKYKRWHESEEDPEWDNLNRVTADQDLVQMATVVDVLPLSEYLV